MLLLAAAMDLKDTRIRNELVFAGIAAGISIWIPHADSYGTIRLLSGLALPVIICWIPFLMHGIGAGDIKLLSVIGCLNGGKCAVYCIFFSLLIGAGLSLGKLLIQRRLLSCVLCCFEYLHCIYKNKSIVPVSYEHESEHRIHFSLAILGGYIVCLVNDIKFF